jgi:hypothetical protein
VNPALLPCSHGTARGFCSQCNPHPLLAALENEAVERSFKPWDEMTDAERAQAIEAGVQFIMNGPGDPTDWENK